MIILGIDTATRVNSAAIISDGAVLSEITLDEGLTHSSRLAGNVELLLKRARLKVAELDGLAVSIGPGSFTGLRVGVSLAKGLAFSTGLPLAGIFTLDALAFRMGSNLSGIEERLGEVVGSKELICPALDAKKNEIYYALYTKREGVLVKLSSEAADSATAAAKRIKEFASGKVIFQGDAFLKFGKEISSILPEAVEAPAELLMPSAVTVARLGEIKIAGGNAGSFGGVQPLYIRKSEAELRKANG